MNRKRTSTDPWALLRELRPDVPFRRLDDLAGEIERWNRRIRLVGPRDLGGIRLQIADALLPFLKVPPPFPLLDLGTGAGLPLLPLAVVFPDAAVTGVEPRHRRVAFVRHAARALGLSGVRVVAGRAPDVLEEHPDLRGAFRSATARALADVPTLLSWLDPFLAPGGLAILPRGGERPPAVEGWELVRDEPYPGPPGVGPRRVAVYARAPVADCFT